VSPPSRRGRCALSRNCAGKFFVFDRRSSLPVFGPADGRLEILQTKCDATLRKGRSGGGQTAPVFELPPPREAKVALHLIDRRDDPSSKAVPYTHLTPLVWSDKCQLSNGLLSDV